jgi:hypothetical protein
MRAADALAVAVQAAMSAVAASILCLKYGPEQAPEGWLAVAAAGPWPGPLVQARLGDGGVTDVLVLHGWPVDAALLSWARPWLGTAAWVIAGHAFWVMAGGCAAAWLGRRWWGGVGPGLAVGLTWQICGIPVLASAADWSGGPFIWAVLPVAFALLDAAVVSPRPATAVAAGLAAGPLGMLRGDAPWWLLVPGAALVAGRAAAGHPRRAVGAALLAAGTAVLVALPVRGWFHGRLADPLAFEPTGPPPAVALVALAGAWLARDQPRRAAIPALLVLYGALSVPGDGGVAAALGLSLLSGALGSTTVSGTARPLATTSNSGGSSVKV